MPAQNPFRAALPLAASLIARGHVLSRRAARASLRTGKHIVRGWQAIHLPVPFGRLRVLKSRLAQMQVASLLAFVVLIVSVAAYLWFTTDDYYKPFASYLASTKIAIPPALIFVTTYAVAFLTGIALQDVPKKLLSFGRNEFLQSCRMMGCWLTAVCAFAAYTIWLIATQTPPSYASFVNAIVAGEADDFNRGKGMIADIQQANSKLGGRYALVAATFEERQGLNAGTREPSVARSKAFVRALSPIDGSTPESGARLSMEDSAWNGSPLRKHALAEAYALYAQAAKNIISPMGEAVGHTARLFDNAHAIYREVANDRTALTTEKLRRSALSNDGNVYYYQGDYANALVQWRRANGDKLERRNLASWGNVIAGLVLTGKLDEAIQEGEAARSWAESNGKAFIESFQFASVLENTAMARLQKGDFDGAFRDFAATHAFQNDALSLQNMAMVHLLIGDRAAAQVVLQRVAPAASAKMSSEYAVKPPSARCVYLLWALALRDEPPAEQAANYLVFLGDRMDETSIGAFNLARVNDLRSSAVSWLPKSAQPCSTLAAIDPFTKLLAP